MENGRRMKELPEILCPWCVRQGGLVIQVNMVAKPLLTFSLAGAQMKLSAIEVPRLMCRLCERYVDGRIDGTEAVFPDPHFGAGDRRTGQPAQG